MRWLRLIPVALIMCAVMTAPAVAEAPQASSIEGTDLAIQLPDGWQVRPKKQTADELRSFIDAFPAVAAQLGLRSSDPDAQIVQAWERITKDFVLMTFDPTNGDTSSIALYHGPFWSSLARWRAQEKSNARRFPGKVLSVDSTKVGTHHAFTSIIQTNNPKVLISTQAIEQPNGSFVIISTTLDPDEAQLAKRILSSVRVV